MNLKSRLLKLTFHLLKQILIWVNVGFKLNKHSLHIFLKFKA